jgi:EmrB/QacA subfamily drug resistance transporter
MTMPDTPQPARPARDRRWISLYVLCAGFLLIVVDMTIVNVALPSIQRDLRFSQAALAWVVNAYLIAFAGLLLLSGRLGDLLGRKRVFLAGLALFTVASVACGLSFSQPVLIAARFVQGVGGAASSAVILGMVVTMFTDPGDRARAIGVFSFVASGGAAVGLIAGGLITQAVSWHWIFFVNVPIGAVVAVLAYRLLDDEKGIGLGDGADVVGAVLVTAALMLGVYAIVDSSNYGLRSPHTIGFGGVAVGLLVAFVVYESLVRNPILPLRLFRSPSLSGANVVQILLTAGFFSFFFIGALDLERVLGYGPLTLGLAFLPVALVMGSISVRFSAGLVQRFGSLPVLLAGEAMIAVALTALALGPAQASYLRDWLVPMVILGIGGGLMFPPLTVIAMSGVAPDDSGLASGLLNTTAQVGGALGLAVLATLSGDRTTQLASQGQAAVEALAGGYHLAWAVGAGLVVASFVITAAVVRQEPAAAHTDDQGEEAAA